MAQNVSDLNTGNHTPQLGRASLGNTNSPSSCSPEVGFQQLTPIGVLGVKERHIEHINEVLSSIMITFQYSEVCIIRTQGQWYCCCSSKELMAIHDEWVFVCMSACTCMHNSNNTVCGKDWNKLCQLSEPQLLMCEKKLKISSQYYNNKYLPYALYVPIRSLLYVPFYTLMYIFTSRETERGRHFHYSYFINDNTEE